MVSMTRRALEKRATGPTEAARRFRLASPTTAVALGVLTLLLEALDVPLESRIHALSFGNYGFELAFVAVSYTHLTLPTSDLV